MMLSSNELFDIGVHTNSNQRRQYAKQTPAYFSYRTYLKDALISIYYLEKLCKVCHYV